MRPGTLRFPVLLALCLLLSVSCSQEPAPTAPIGTVDVNDSHATDTPSRGRPSTYGNCLSTPVIFAESHGLAGADVNGSTGLRGMPGTATFTLPYDEVTTIDGFPVYQNPSVNEWQADWATGADIGGVVPVELDWSDNLVRQTWTDRSKVRIEVVLTTPLDPVMLALEGYSMFSLGGSRLEEIFVTNTTRYTALTATVYSNVARLTIEKLDDKNGSPQGTLYSSACYERYFVDGPSSAFTAEVNMGGKCIYGFNWDIGDSPLAEKSGWYRLTFSLDPAAEYVDESGVAYGYARNTLITSLAQLDVDDSDIAVYQPILAPDGLSSSLDVYVSTRKPGRKRP